MPNYRRVRVPGGTYSFTVNLLDRQQQLLVEHVGLLREAFRDAQAVSRFSVIGIVVLPDHLHCLWQLPEGETDNAIRWRRIKACFSRGLPAVEFRSNSRQAERERGIWQRRFWEHVIVDEEDLRHHLDYIHINPVKHGYVNRAADWPCSSIHRHIAQGSLEVDWACEPGIPHSMRRNGGPRPALWRRRLRLCDAGALAPGITRASPEGFR